MATSWDYVEKCRNAYKGRGWNFVAQEWIDSRVDELWHQEEVLFDATFKRGWFPTVPTKQQIEIDRLRQWVPNPHL